VLETAPIFLPNEVLKSWYQNYAIFSFISCQPVQKYEQFSNFAHHQKLPGHSCVLVKLYECSPIKITDSVLHHQKGSKH